jgi:hypothetical protein
MLSDIPDDFSHGYGIFILLGENDVLGLVINLPFKQPAVISKLPSFEPEIDPMLFKRLWDPERTILYDKFPINQIDKLEGSYIEYFLNGKSLGISFTDLYYGKYYPAISLFNGAACKINFGPGFAHSIPEGARGYHEAIDLPLWGISLKAYKDALLALKTKEKEDQKVKREIMKLQKDLKKHNPLEAIQESGHVFPVHIKS